MAKLQGRNDQNCGLCTVGLWASGLVGLWALGAGNANYTLANEGSLGPDHWALVGILRASGTRSGHAPSRTRRAVGPLRVVVLWPDLDLETTRLSFTCGIFAS